MNMMQIFFQVVAPTIQSPACQEQVVEAAKVVAKSVEGVVDASQVSPIGKFSSSSSSTFF